MSGYVPLVSVQVDHSFFGDGVCRVVDLALDPPSVALARNAGLVVRQGAGRLDLFRDTGDGGTLELFASDPEAPFRLDLHLTSRDPGFWDYTEGGPPRDRILAFDGGNAVLDPKDGTLRLSKEEVVSEADQVSLVAEGPAVGLTGRALVPPPLALIRVPLSDGAGGLLEPPSPGGWIYTLRFAARRTYWRYLLLGRLAEGDVAILDPDGVAQFERVGEETLPGDRKASSFRSTTRLPLEEFSSRRFQLRTTGGSGNGNGRILIKRLPVAGARAGRRETVAGETAMVSDILVNG